MPKGLFSQGVTVLLTEPVSIHKIKEYLRPEFEISHIGDASEQWVFSGPSITIPFRPGVNGVITIDIVDRPWPDAMGDPKEETMLFGAWSMGFLGPFTFPGNLKRAAQQPWGYPEGKQDAESHKAFIRIRSTYTQANPEQDAPLLPEDYEAFPELMLMMELVRDLLGLPEALCYFNPNGECLSSAQMINALFERFEQTNLPPLELWSNIRMFNLPHHKDWLLMDTVGMMQLDVMDHEIIFPKHVYDPNEVASFLRNVSDYLLENGLVVKDGDTIEGPGGVSWQAVLLEEGTAEPPRQVLRWLAMDGREVPPSLH